MSKEQKLKKIVSRLIKLTTDEYITVSELADLSSYSSRSIYALLKSEQFLGYLHGASIEAVQNKGIRLMATAQQKNLIVASLNEVDLTRQFSFEDDLGLLLALLRTEKPLTLDYLSELLHYSKKPIIDILERLEEYVSKFSCHIEKKPNCGVSITGLECKKRDLYSDLIKDFDTEGLNGLFTKETVDKVIQLVRTTEINLNSKFCSYDYRTLISHLLIQIDRLKFNHSLDDSMVLGTEIQEYYVSLIIKMQIEQLFTLTLSAREVFEIEKKLLSLRKQSSTQLIIHFDEAILDYFIELISKRLNVDLTHDIQLKQSLASHLKPAIRRIKYGASIENPLIEKIKDKYTEIYLAIITAIEYIEETEQIYFDSNEIGYICLHIVAAVNRSEQIRTIKTILICDAGLTFESYLKSLIECTFSEIEIPLIVSPEHFGFMEDIAQYQLILNSTTADIKRDNVVNIDTLLTDTSCAAIRHWLFSRELTEMNSLKKQFNDILLFFKDEECASQEDFIDKYCSFLINNNYVTEDYKTSVIERMKRSTTAIGRGIAVPHGSLSYVKKSMILVVKLNQPIKWEDQTADFIFFAIIGKDISNEYSKIFRKISKIVSNDELTFQLKNCTSINELREMLFTY